METRKRPTLHRDWIDPEARSIVDRLQRAGFPTYLVGGCVRDLLAGIHPKDFDIATSAHPEQVRKLIRGSYIIGKRFQLVLVKRGPIQFEVATFRRNAFPDEIEATEFTRVDNFFGTPQQDAQRRDFTINALFYDPIGDELIDYVGGLADIDKGLIRMIGNPELRLKEDSIRILRAIRLSHKLRFSIEETLRASIEINSQELQKAILPRKREEYFKLLRLDDPSLVFRELFDLKILPHILPTLDKLWLPPQNSAIFSHFLHHTHQIVDDPSSTIQLMIPMILALSEIQSLQSDDMPWDDLITDTFLKHEWGLFKTEQQALYEAQQILIQMQDMNALLKRGTRRQRSFFAKDYMDIALSMAKANFLLSGQQWIKIEALLKQFQWGAEKPTESQTEKA